MLGPISGGYIVDLIGFDQASFVIVIMFLVVGFFYATCHCCKIQHTLQNNIVIEENPTEQEVDRSSEVSPLLINV